MEKQIKQQKRDRILKVVAPIIATIILLLIWEAIVVIKQIPEYVIAKPSAIFSYFFNNFSSLWPDCWVTIKTLFIAYIMASLLALACAAGICTSEIFTAGLGNLIIFMICTPMMTLVPLLVLIMGFGPMPRILVTALQAFPIINMNAMVGFQGVPKERIELMQSLKATKFQTFKMVRFPSSVSEVFTGLRLGFINCITCLFGAEFAGGNEGLGARIVSESHFMRIAPAFAAIVCVAIIGMTVYTFVDSMEGKFKTWKD